MRIGLNGGASSIERFIEQAQTAEAEGFSSLWYPSAIAGDPVAAMAAAGRATTSIELGTAVLQSYTSHPVLQANRMAGAAFAMGRAGLTLGISTHDDAELATALAAKPDYVALGPIFPTTLKSMRFAPQGIAKITEWKKRVGPIPLVAIGGIKFEQSAEIYAAGADSIAVVSDVTQHADPDARVRQWLGQSAETT